MWHRVLVKLVVTELVVDWAMVYSEDLFKVFFIQCRYMVVQYVWLL